MKTKKEKHPISFYINGMVVCASLVAFAACVPGTQKATTSISVSSQINKADVSSVSIVNDQLVIDGVNLNVVKNVKVENNGSTFSFNVISSSSTQLIAQSISAASLMLGAASKLILSDAYGASTFQVTFSMTDSSVTTAKINDGAVTLAKLDKSTVQKGQTLKYNGTAWTYADLSESQYFLGTVNMTTKATSLGGTLTTTNASSTPGDYYIVSTGGTLGTTVYASGDWVISDGYDWLRIPAAKTTVTTFEGRQGAVTLAPADYVHLLSSNKLTGSSLNNFADVDITTSAPANGYVLAYNNATSKWEPKDLTTQFQAKQATGNYITALTGDITASGPSGGGSAAATVASVGGASAANIASTVTAVLTNATDVNTTAGTLVKRNTVDKSIQVGAITSQGLTSSAAVTVSSGNLTVSAGNLSVTGNISATGTLSGTLTGASVSGNIPGNAANVTGTVAVANGGTGQTTFNNDDLLYYSTSTSKLTGFAAPTGIQKILAFDPVGTGYKWLSNSSASFLKSDSVSGTYFTALAIGDLPSGTITGASSTLSNATYSFVPQYNGTTYTIKDSPISVKAANSFVGIGTTTPAAQLDVSGSMRVSGSALEINSNGTSHFIGHERNLIGSGTVNDLGIQANSTSEAITFKQGANTERMRVHTNGYVGIGTAAPAYPLHVYTSTLAATVASFQSGTGSCTVVPNTGVSCSSDMRLKEHIENIMNGLDKVLKLRGVTFQWKERPAGDEARHMGFIAQEVEKVAPELVREDKKGFKQVNYANFVAVLTEAIKDLFKKWFDDSALLHREIASVKAENEALKAKVQKAEKEQAEMKARLDRIEKALNKK